eukprot:ANDGO_07909.mRNA.1 hypothetical protein
MLPSSPSQDYGTLTAGRSEEARSPASDANDMLTVDNAAESGSVSANGVYVDCYDRSSTTLQPPTYLSENLALQENPSVAQVAYTAEPEFDLNCNKRVAVFKADCMRFVESANHANMKVKEWRYWGFSRNLSFLGVGIGLFLRFCKAIAWILLLFFVLAIPAIVIFSKGTAMSTESIFGKFSMGNLGAERPPLWLSVADLGSAVLFFCVMLWYRERQQMSAMKIDVSAITTADYSVHVTNLPPTATDPVDLASFFSRYGQVVTVAISLNFSALCEKIEKEKAIKMQIYRFEAAKQKGKMVPCTWKGQCEYELELSSVRRKIAVLKQKKYKCTGQAFVTFLTEQQRDACLADLNHAVALSYLAPNTAHRKFQNKYVKCSIPAEPSDVVWENLAVSSASRFWRFLASAFISIVIILISFAIVYGLQSAQTSTNNVGLDVLSSIAVFVTNRILKEVLEMLSKFEMHHFKSLRQRTLLWKTVFAQCINSVGVILAIHSPSKSTFYKDAAATISLIVLLEAVGDIVLEILWYPAFHILRRVKMSMAHFQKDLELAAEYPQYSLSERYAYVIKTFLICMAFGSIIPFVFIPCFFSAAISYFVDKFNLLRLYMRPPMFSDHCARGSIHFVSAAVVLRAALTILAYQGQYRQTTESDNGYLGVQYTTLAIGIIAFLSTIIAYSDYSQSRRLQKFRAANPPNTRPFTDFRLSVYQPPLLTSDVITFNFQSPTQSAALKERVATMGLQMQQKISNTKQSVVASYNKSVASAKNALNSVMGRVRGNKPQQQQPQQQAPGQQHPQSPSQQQYGQHNQPVHGSYDSGAGQPPSAPALSNLSASNPYAKPVVSQSPPAVPPPQTQLGSSAPCTSPSAPPMPSQPSAAPHPQSSKQNAPAEASVATAPAAASLQQHLSPSNPYAKPDPSAATQAEVFENRSRSTSATRPVPPPPVLSVQKQTTPSAPALPLGPPPPPPPPSSSSSSSSSSSVAAAAAPKSASHNPYEEFLPAGSSTKNASPVEEENPYV